jgi:hypothetical protein
MIAVFGKKAGAHKFISFLLPATADKRVLEVNTQRLGPSQALETSCENAVSKKRLQILIKKR